jgi:hypothetical protein
VVAFTCFRSARFAILHNMLSISWRYKQLLRS